MELDVATEGNRRPRGSRGPLTPAEKQYRKDHGLCTYCEQKGHDVDTCPKIKAKEARAQRSNGNSRNVRFNNVEEGAQEKPGNA